MSERSKVASFLAYQSPSRIQIPTLLNINTPNQELGPGIQRRVRFLWCSLGLCAQATTGEHGRDIGVQRHLPGGERVHE